MTARFEPPFPEQRQPMPGKTAAMTPRPVPTVGTGHLHHPKVSVPEQARRVLALLESRGMGHWASFSELVAECTMPIEIVASLSSAKICARSAREVPRTSSPGKG